MKPLRTALFVPGNRPDRAAKALDLAADAVILDLEDAVPIAEKEKTRALVRDVLESSSGKRVYVRVNGLSTPYCREDLEAVVCGNLTGILMPKVESPENVFQTDILLTELEKAAGLEVGSLEVLSLCESATALEGIYQTASANPEHHKISAVALGGADYVLDMGVTMTRRALELDYPRQRIPVACRAAGISPPIDTPWMVDIKDIDGLVEDAKRAKAFGFQGKLLIHPIQIEPCNEVFTPTEEEIVYAKRLIEAFEEAERTGSAVFQFEGNLVDYPMLERAKRICALARIIS